MGNKDQISNDRMDIFLHLLVEEFLIKKNMQNTLKSFREEWKRPTENESILCWYDVAVKLRLHDFSKGTIENSVLHNIVNELVKESSIRTRRKAEVIVSGLTPLPKRSSVPNLNDTTSTALDNVFDAVVIDSSIVENNSFDANIADAPTIQPIEFSNNDYDKNLNSNTGMISNLSNISSNKDVSKYLPSDSNQMRDSKIKTSKTVKKHQPRLSAPSDSPTLRRLLNINLERYNKNRYLSNEYWIPENVRMNSIKRNIAVIKDNVDTIKILETYQTRELKSHSMTDIERINSEKFPGQTTEMPCACCMQVYLIENLPRTISQKAILDIRLKWSGGLSSQTIFGSTNDLINNSRNTWSILRKDELLKAVPRCYDEVKICLFCSQFFEDQISYRPLLNDILHQERTRFKNEILLKEKEYWDPLKMIEKDREEQELLLSQINSNTLDNFNNNTNYPNSFITSNNISI